MARDIASEAGQTWSVRALQALAEVLQPMDSQDNRKDKGRMRVFTGPGWILRVASKPAHYESLRVAGRLLGQTMLAPAAAETRTFAFYFDELTGGAAKLPQVAEYGVVGLLRALCAVLVSVDLPTLGIAEAVWVKHVRDMTKDTTAVAFRAVGVGALADAEVMVAVLKRACSNYWGTLKPLSGGGSTLWT